jgi:hypothetical protein
VTLETSSNNFVAVEDLLIAVQFSASDDVELIHAEATVDLQKFALTPEELHKFKLIFKELNTKLSESFQENCPAVSVNSEIRSKLGNDIKFRSNKSKTV